MQLLHQHWTRPRTPCMLRVLLLLQWPLHACTAFVQAAQQQPKSPGVCAAVRLLETFFSTAGTHFLQGSDGTPVASLQAGVQQQLVQSGLLQQLPALLIAAAVELSAQAKDRSLPRVQHAADLYKLGIQMHTKDLFTLVCQVSLLWSSDDINMLKGLASTCAAAMQLALAVTRNISAEVQEHMRNPGGCQTSAFDMQVWPAGCSFLHWCINCCCPLVGSLGRTQPVHFTCDLCTSVASKSLLTPKMFRHLIT
mgnify:CR=1 FL=1